MKIKKARVIGFGKIQHEQTIEPGSDIIIVTGQNAQGKTSFLNAISSVFEGSGSLPPVPINKDSKEAVAEVTLDNGLVLTRKITPKAGVSFEIRDGAGKPVESPQKYIERRLKLFSFNPLEFAESDAKAQAKMAKRVISMVVGSDMTPIASYLESYSVTPAEGSSLVDAIDDLIADNKGPVYMHRRDLAREVKTLGDVADAAGGEVPDLQDMQANVEMAQKRVTQSETAIGVATGMTEDAEATLAAVRQAKLKITSCRGRMATEPQNATIISMLSAVDVLDQAAEKVQAGVTYLTTAVIPGQRAGLEKFRAELQEFTRQLGAAEAQAKQAVAAKEATAKYRAARDEMATVEADLKHLRELRELTIANARFPVEGLSVDGDTVIVGGLPFVQCSQAQRLMISIRLAMAMNPELRVMRITDGNSLDGATFNLLRDAVAEHDFQLWIERVSDEPNGVGYYFENGEIAYSPAGDDAAPKAKKRVAAQAKVQGEQGSLL